LINQLFHGFQTCGGLAALMFSVAHSNLPYATSDCPSLQFCQLTDIVHVTNCYIVLYKILYCIS